MPNVIGISGPRFFADPSPGPDETSFQVPNDDAQYYNSPYYKLHQNQLQPVPTPTTTPPIVRLDEVVGQDLVAPIQAAKQIAFHTVGDTGAAKVDATQTAQRALANQAGVADAMAAEVQSGQTPVPAFFFHLGDVIYNFGEDQFYYDQFYEPYRAYDRPIFAIPGNHDGVCFGSGTAAPQIPTLTGFLANFCTANPAPSPDAPNLVRSTMTQPGVYFTLDAPFVSIIGLYSNVLEGPGVISSQGGMYPISDEQVQFLTSELERLKPAREENQIAVLLAVHHPPLSVDAKHGGSTGISNDIDSACQAAGLWPDAVLSGHAHLYQRFTRTVGSSQIPYIVAGSGGFAVTPPRSVYPPVGTVVGDCTLDVDPIMKFGFVRAEVDMSGAVPTLTLAFETPASGPSGSPGTQVEDSVSINLATHQKVATGSTSAARAPRRSARSTAKKARGPASKARGTVKKTRGTARKARGTAKKVSPRSPRGAVKRSGTRAKAAQRRR